MNWLYNTAETIVSSSLTLSDINLRDTVYSQIDKKEGRITKIISEDTIKVSFSNQRWDYKYRPLSSLSKK